MKSWLGLVNERNGLVRKTSELSLRMKELELEDRQYEIDKKLSALSNVPGTYKYIYTQGKWGVQFRVFKDSSGKWGGGGNLVLLLTCLCTAGYKLDQEEQAQFDDLCDQKIKIVEERHELVMQTEEERIR